MWRSHISPESVHSGAASEDAAERIGGVSLRKPTKLPTPSNWASLKPFGIGEQKPNNYKEVFRAAADEAGLAAEGEDAGGGVQPGQAAVTEGGMLAAQAAGRAR